MVVSSTPSVKSTDKAPPEKPAGPGPNEYDDAEKNYQPKSFKFWSVIIGMYLSLFVVALDRTIIATAIPKITDEFNSIGDIGWYGSAYMLTTACFMPIFGRIYKIWSTKWVFVCALVIFEVGSAICGAAPNSIAFILGRAIAGLGSAGIFTGSMMIMLPLVPLRKRPLFSSFFGIAFGVSSVLGPLIGGSFTDKVTWRWCFYINLPVGGFAMVAVLFFFTVGQVTTEKRTLFAIIKGLDPIGIFFLVPSIVSLILALQWGGTTYPWSAPKIIGLLVTFAVLFIGFVVYEFMTPETAMAPKRVVLNRSVAAGQLFTFLLMGSMMSMIYYLSIWFQAVKGDSAMHAGISTIPLVLSMVITSILAATVTQKIGYYVPAMLFTPIFCSIGSGLLSTLSPSSNHSYWIGYQVIFGVGIGCGFQTASLIAQTVLPRPDVPIGVSLNFFQQQLGGSVFLSVAQNVFSNSLINGLSGIAGLDAEAIVNTGATDLIKIVPSNEFSAVIEIYNHSLTRVFLMSAALSAITILAVLAVEWKSIKSENGPPKSSEAKMEEGDTRTEPKEEVLNPSEKRE